MRDTIRQRLPRTPVPPAPAPLTPFQPGELITAEALNRIVAHVVALEARVADLEKGSRSGS